MRRSTTVTSRDEVIVLGAGMAGLAAAAALAPVAGRITVVERDPLPTAAIARRGTPQARHIHALLAGGRQALEELLPGFDAALEERGAREVTNGGGFGFRTADGWIAPVPDLTLRCVSRPVIEAIARRLVRDLPTVDVVDGVHVEGLTAGPDGAITGVTGERDGQPVRLQAALVVDASGRGSAAPGWLAEHDSAPPPEQVVDPRIWYATSVGRGLADLPEGMHAMLVTPTPEHPAGAGIVPTEDGDWTVSLTGVAPAPAPRNVDDFRRHAARLRSPAVDRAIACLDLDDEVVVTRSTGNRARRYDRAAPPAGLVLLGDSVCALDPVYGQGMTVAAVQARALRRQVARLGPRHPRLTRSFQREAWRIARLAWDQATAADLQLPSTDGVVPPPVRVVNAYLRRIVRLTAADAGLARRLGRVMHLLDPPSAMFHPAVAARVLADIIRPVRIPPHEADSPAPKEVPHAGHLTQTGPPPTAVDAAADGDAPSGEGDVAG